MSYRFSIHIWRRVKDNFHIIKSKTFIKMRSIYYFPLKNFKFIALLLRFSKKKPVEKLRYQTKMNMISRPSSTYAQKLSHHKF